jgi:hypothetical protein
MPSRSDAIDGFPLVHRLWRISMFRSRRAGALVAVLALLVSLVSATSLSAAPASALPPRDSCFPLCEPDPAPPAPTVTKISSLSPYYGWSGDVVTINGTGLDAATVTVKGLDATIASRTSTRLTIKVPDLTGDIYGHQVVPVRVSSPKGTATAGFTLSPSLRVVSSQSFRAGADGRARAVVDVNRHAGTVTGEITVDNTQPFASLSVNASVVWLNDAGVVVGYTPPQKTTVKGVFYNWPHSTSSVAVPLVASSVGPDPGRAPGIRSGRVVFVRDHAAEMASTLANAFQTGQTIATVVSRLGPFM